MLLEYTHELHVLWFDGTGDILWYVYVRMLLWMSVWFRLTHCYVERWGAGVETQQNVREEIGGWGRVPFNEPYAPLLSTIYDGA